MSCVLQASWIWAGEEDDGQGSIRTGWHIIEVEPHTCRSTGAASGKGKKVTGKGGKGKGKGAPDRSRGMRNTAYRNSQLARVVRAVVLQYLCLDRTRLGTLKTAGWRRQYEGLEYPMLSTTAIQNSDLHDATAISACGRPEMRSSQEGR